MCACVLSVFDIFLERLSFLSMSFSFFFSFLFLFFLLSLPLRIFYFTCWTDAIVTDFAFFVVFFALAFRFLLEDDDFSWLDKRFDED